MAAPDDDLPTLLQRKDHINVLRYVRAHQLREPLIVVEHGKALLGPEFKRKLGDENARLAALEQIALSALDLQQHEVAAMCLDRLKAAIGKEAVRFRVLLGRCLEAAGDTKGAMSIYDDLLSTNPANLAVLKRKYCLAEKPVERMAALNHYLQQNMADSAAWFEMANLRLTMGDFVGASFALEEVVLGCPIDAPIHIQLAEVYATIGGIDNLQLARKHMAQALELDGTNKRAMFGLLSVSNSYLVAVSNASKKQAVDEHSTEVAKELVKYGADKILKQYKGTKMYAAVQTLVGQYTKGL
jgi:tetratricopeptide (TPR) repeat protein